MLKNIKQNIILLTIGCLSMVSYLSAEDCYVFKGQDNGVFDEGEVFEDGSEANPYSRIVDCTSQLSNSRNNTIYVGSGIYEIRQIPLGARRLIGSGVNVTYLVPEESNTDGFLMGGGEISDVTFDRNFTYNDESNFNTAIVVNQTNFQNNTDIHNCFFKNGINNYAIDMVEGNVDIRNNYFDYGVFHFNGQNNINFLNNMIGHSSSFTGSPEGEIYNVIMSHNLFISDCNLGAFGTANTQYNLTFQNSNGQYCGSNYFNSSDGTCGTQGQFQGEQYFNYCNELDLLSGDAFDGNFFAVGENSILIDTGNPDPSFNDPDGTRADIGIMGGLYPWVNVGAIITNFTVDPIVVPLDGQININSRAITE